MSKSREIQLTWSQLKTLATDKGLSFNYDKNASNTLYEVFVSDNNMTWYSRLTLSADITDFTTNYLSSSNKRTPVPVKIGNETNDVDIIVDGANVKRLAVDSASAQTKKIMVDERKINCDTVTYIGIALPGSGTSSPVWRIIKSTEVHSSNSVASDVLFADGNTDFDNVWDNRESYTYN